MNNLGFIGTGKISGAVIEAFCSLGDSDISIRVSPRNREKSISLEKKYPGVVRMESNQEVVDRSEVIFIALKPAVCRDIIQPLKFRKEHTVISLVPYLGYSELSRLVDPAKDVCRAIPLPTVVNHICPVPLFRPPAIVTRLFEKIGQPLIIKEEAQLHAIWTLTGLISPFYDLLAELSAWASEKGVEKTIADKYVADMFNSLSYASSVMENPDFKSLSHHAATPGGMNERAGIEIADAEAHKAYRDAADRIFENFRGMVL